VAQDARESPASPGSDRTVEDGKDRNNAANGHTGAPGERVGLGGRAVAGEQDSAAELLIAGRLREALAAYDGLAARNPEQPAYAAVVEILRRQIDERCRQRLQTGGGECEK
jgi:hypothetical protein